MIKLELPETQLQPVDLKILPYQTKGSFSGDASQLDRLTGRVSLGQVWSRSITADTVKSDENLLSFFQANASAADFYLTHMKCTFKPAEKEQFMQAWINISLARDDRGREPRPVMWSMQPEKLARNVEVTKEVTLGASLKFEDIGTEAGGKREEKWTVEKVFLQAYGEGESEAYWQFNQTAGVEIDGLYSLNMIIYCPKNIKVRGTVSLRATVKRKRLGILSYTTDHPDASQITFNLPQS